MKNIIISLLFLLLMNTFAGCASINPMIPPVDTIADNDTMNSYDALEIVTQTDCHFMGIRVMTFLPGKLKAQFEDERGVFFYADNFKNAFNAFYTKAGIFIPENESSEPFAFAEKGSRNSLTLLSCDNLDFTKTKRDKP